MASVKNFLREPDVVYNLPLVPEDTPEEKLEAIRAGVIAGYRIKTTITGNTAHAAIFPYWSRKTDLPQIPRRERSPDEIAAANERRSIQRGQDLVNTNFGKGDIWFTGTWDDAHLPQDDDAQLRYAQNFIKRLRRRHKKNGGKPNAFRWFITLEADAAENIRPNIHAAIHGTLSLDEVEALWKGGGRNQTRRIVPDKNGVIGMAVYINKPAGKRRRRWYASTNLKQPDIRTADKKATKAQVRKAAESQTNLEDYFAKLYPGWEVTQIARPANNGRNGGVYLYARICVKENLQHDTKTLYKTTHGKRVEPPRGGSLGDCCH
ncbi:MAG: hypothetical protein ACK5JF_14435 [Oscillospiraceae bacterium]